MNSEFGNFAFGYQPLIFKIFLKSSLMGHACHLPVMALSFWADRSGQTVQTKIRLLPEEQSLIRVWDQSDQGLHCLLFHLHHLDKIPKGLASLFEFYVDDSKDFWYPKILKLYGM